MKVPHYIHPLLFLLCMHVICGMNIQSGNDTKKFDEKDMAFSEDYEEYEDLDYDDEDEDEDEEADTEERGKSMVVGCKFDGKSYQIGHGPAAKDCLKRICTKSKKKSKKSKGKWTIKISDDCMCKADTGHSDKDCHSVNSKWESGLEQLQGSDDKSYEKKWEDCGFKCRLNDACDVWQYSNQTGWCGNFKEKEKGDAKMVDGEDITGRKDCPAEPMEMTRKCSFDDHLLAKSDEDRNHDNTKLFTWRDGKIPYYFSGRVLNSDAILIREQMDLVEKHTCFRFVETNSWHLPIHHLKIVVADTADASCFSGFSGAVGRDGQMDHMIMEFYLKLTDYWRCDRDMIAGGVLHELMHVVGVMHTQKRKDRDTHIEIHEDHIEQTNSSKYQYEECTHCPIYPTIKYECDSIMHYGYMTLQDETLKLPTMTSRHNGCQLNAQGGEFATSNDWALLKLIGDQVCSQGGGGCTARDYRSKFDCYRWKKRGYCTTNSWVKRNCARTCDPNC